MKPVELLGSQIPRQNGSNNDLLKVRVLDAKKGKALVQAQGVLQEVSTDIPLKPGQLFFVKQEQGEANMVWRVIGDIEEGFQALPLKSLLAGIGFPESAENLTVLGILRDLGLSFTKTNITLIKNYLHMLGSGDAVGNLFSMVLSLHSEPIRAFLLSSLKEFLKHRLSENLQPARDSQKIFFQPDPQESAAGIKETSERLRELLVLLMRNLSKGASFEKATLSSDQKLLGAQLFAIARQDSSNESFFYFVPFSSSGLDYQGEACFYPPLEGEDKQLWRLVLSLETRNLGWVQTDLVLSEKLLEVGVNVEEEATKLFIEEHLPALKQSLSKLGLQFYYRGCKLTEVGRMTVPGGKEENVRQQDYLQVDLLI